MKALQYELLGNNVSFVISKCESEYETINALGMAEVEFYRNATQRAVVQDVAKNLAPGTSIAIIDASSQALVYLAGDDEHALLQDKRRIERMVRKVNGQQEYTLTSTAGENVSTMAVYRVYPNWNWVVISFFDSNKLFHYTYDAMMFSFAVAGVFLVFIFFVVYQLSSGISRSIVALEQGAQRLAKNDFDHAIDIPGEAEFGSLAHSFNVMASEIRQAQDQLRNSIAEERRVNSELHESQQRQNLALFGADLGLWDWDLSNNQETFDARWCAMIGRSVDEVKPYFGYWHELLHPADVPAVDGILEAHLKGKTPYYEVEFRMKHSDGHWVWILARGRVVARDAQQLPLRMTGTHMDISARKQAETSLYLAASVFEHAHEGILIAGLYGEIIDVNDAFARISGFTRDEVRGQNLSALYSDRQGPEFFAALQRDLRDHGFWYGEVWNRHKNGDDYPVMLAISAVPDATGVVQHYVSLFSDISEIKAYQNQLEHLAHFDVLTSLPNRVQLSEFLHHAMAQERRRNQFLAVVYLDLDGFKAINDQHGHDVGDLLLVALARRMAMALRQGDMLARIGGDEFVAVLVDLAGADCSQPTLNRLLSAASEQVTINYQELKVSASLGITFYPQEQPIDADQLLRQADQAMYQAKVGGKNRCHLFDAEQDSHIRRRHESLERIRLALEQHEFVLYYQPKVNMLTGELMGVEALIRWQHPQRGILAPADFLPVIEDHPLAVRLGEWVIETALTQVECWHAGGLDTKVSVNIGARQLQQVNFVDRLRGALAAHPLVKPSRLEMEILETSALENIAQVSQVIDKCKLIGVTFALDDFGTGYSSLTYLKGLDVTQLKIDRSFVRDMLEDPEDLAILQGIISLAAAFKRQVIAEGVESLAHGTLLLQMGCEIAQGYIIARPMPPDEFPGWLATWKPALKWFAPQIAS